MNEILYGLSVWLLPALTAITLHEAAHGYIAWKCGDDTAKQLGRVTFNPLNHIDLWGTVIVPGLLLLSSVPFLFGWAKPVPVNFARLNSPRPDMIYVAAAGPASNLLMALIAALILHLVEFAPSGTDQWLLENLKNAILLNLVLAVFNMLPIPPLDGGRVAVGLLPYAAARRLASMERFGLAIVLLLIFLIPWMTARTGIGFNPVDWLIYKPVNYLAELVLLVTGH